MIIEVVFVTGLIHNMPDSMLSNHTTPTFQ